MVPSITTAEVKAAVITFVAAFLATDPASAIIGELSGSQPVDVGALRAAAVAGVAAVAALLYHSFVGQPATGRAK